MEICSDSSGRLMKHGTGKITILTNFYIYLMYVRKSMDIFISEKFLVAFVSFHLFPCSCVWRHEIYIYINSTNFTIYFIYLFANVPVVQIVTSGHMKHGSS